MRLVDETKTNETGGETQIVVSYPQIIVAGTAEKPYYNIMYVDNKDGEVHLGFGSYSLAYVFEWLEAYFGVKTAHVIDPESLRPKGLYTAHEVAEIIADLFGDTYACNFNGIDEWLPIKCELQDYCPNTYGVACWEQYLKHREAKMEE